MKNTSPRSFVSHGLALLSAAGLSLSTLSTTDAAISADFSGGVSTTEVDAWKGRAGDGWKTAWSVVNNKNTSTTFIVSDTTPLSSGSGNYLSATLVNQDETTRGMSVGRQLDPSVLPYTEAHTVSFEFRLDTPIADLHRIYLFDNIANSLSSETAGTTWLIRIDNNGLIRLFNGKSSILTSMSFNDGDTYRFTIDVSPSSVAEQSSYNVRIDNLTLSTSYESGKLLFYDPSASVGGFMNFYASATVGNSITYSLDNIHVIPEASAVSLGGIGLLILLGGRHAFVLRNRIR